MGLGIRVVGLGCGLRGLCLGAWVVLCLCGSGVRGLGLYLGHKGVNLGCVKDDAWGGKYAWGLGGAWVVCA